MAARKKTYCLRGHPREGYYNTYVDSKGWTQCRECQRIRLRAYYRRRRARGERLTKKGWVKDV